MMRSCKLEKEVNFGFSDMIDGAEKTYSQISDFCYHFLSAEFIFYLLPVVLKFNSSFKIGN